MTVIDKIDGVWATNGLIDNDLTPAKKSVGFVEDERPTCDILNYITNRCDSKIDEIIDYIDANIVYDHACNWEKMLNDPTASNLLGILYHPDIRRWLTYGSNQEVWASVDAHQWIATKVHDLAYGVNLRSGVNAIDLTRYLIVNNNDDIEYSTDGDSTWGTETDATIGGTGDIVSIKTKHPDSSFTMIARGNDDIRIAATGIGGGWVAPTTPPITSANLCRGLVYLGGTSWGFISNSIDRLFFISTDDGDTWVDATNQYPDTSAGGIVYNPDTNALLIMGDDGVYRNTDLSEGIWTKASGLNCGNLVYCGNNIWVGSLGSYFAISRDDGQSFSNILIRIHIQSTGENLRAISQITKSENQLIACASNGRSYRSISLADAFTF